MEIIKVDKLTIMSLQLHNVYDLKAWDKYDDPLFSDYNFPDLDDYEMKNWFNTRTSKLSSKSFAVTLEGERTIGLINIKDIRRVLKVANLGIVFNPRFISKGYGTTALRAIIKYYFEDMNMRSLYLDVAKHNKRAIKCYEKCGFKKVKKYTIKSNGISKKEIHSRYIEEDFMVKDGIIHLYCYKMRLSKNDYESFI